MILEPRKVGRLAFCRTVLIYTDLHGKCKGEPIGMYAKSTHFDQNPTCPTFHNSKIITIEYFPMIFFEVLLFLLI